MTRVLAFSASMKRPLLVRLCMLQMQAQTYPCSHGIFINSDQYKNHQDPTNYCVLLTDIKIAKGSNVKVAYGQQGHQHFNHMTALQLFDIDQFDLFLKIDDDDIYRVDYVKHVVADFEQRQWDFSGVCSTGLVNNNQFEQRERVFFSKRQENIYKHPLDEAMPGTYAFSKKALQLIIKQGQEHQWEGRYEDTLWLKWMLQADNIDCQYRQQQDYTYVVHSTNTSTSRVV